MLRKIDLFAGHRGGFWSKERKKSLYLGILLLLLSLVIQVGLGRYSARSASSANFAGDIFLDNLPVLDLRFVIIEFAIILWTAAWLMFCFRPRYLLFGIKAVALFVIFRSFFISLTHIGIYPQQIELDGGGAISGLYNLFTFQGNYFFSGHAGFPFLMALVFWEERIIRRVFLLATFLFGASALLAHVHYSIDVFAAPFITYGIFKIAARLFPGDYVLLNPLGDGRH